jgi:FtsH-binding integral membrane protein
MFMKVVYSLLSFLLVGLAFGSALTNYYNVKFVKEGTTIKAITLPWYVLLALMVLLLIQVAQLFSMLKAVKREFMQMDPDE